ncbi:von Willebrand factor type A domain protein, partial [Ostertagia ostertagi]
MKPSGGDTAVGVDEKVVVVIVDATLALQPTWNSQVDFLMKTLSFAKGRRIGLVSLNCNSELLLRLERHSEEEIKKKILGRSPKFGHLKSISEAFNLAEYVIHPNAGVSRVHARVIVLASSAVDDCSNYQHEVTAYDIASRNWRPSGVRVLFIASGKKTPEMEKLAYNPSSVISVENFDPVDKSVYQRIAHWICVDDGTTALTPRPTTT